MGIWNEATVTLEYSVATGQQTGEFVTFVPARTEWYVSRSAFLLSTSPMRKSISLRILAFLCPCNKDMREITIVLYLQ
jgi:hypothetical protein